MFATSIILLSKFKAFATAPGILNKFDLICFILLILNLFFSANAIASDKRTISCAVNAFVLATAISTPALVKLN